MSRCWENDSSFNIQKGDNVVFSLNQHYGIIIAFKGIVWQVSDVAHENLVAVAMNIRDIYVLDYYKHLLPQAF